MNTNDDFENKRLMEEIDKLENDPAIQTEEGAVKNRNTVLENIIFLIIIIAVIIGVIYLYSTKEDFKDATILQEAEMIADSESYTDDKKVYQVDEDYIVDDNDYDASYESAEKKFAEQRENIIVSKTILNTDKNLILCLNNQNKSTIPNVYIYVVFYDGENNIIGIDYTTIEILMGEAERYITFTKTPENFERVDTFITKEYFGDSTNTILNDKISYEIKENKEDYTVDIEVKNNSDREIDIAEFSIIYYDVDGNILDVENKYSFDIKKNRTDTISLYGIWNYETGEEIKYDHYEIILNSAISYDRD